MAKYLSSLSDKQWDVISKSYEKDMDRLGNSDIFIATGADLSISGQNAFDALESENDESKKKSI